ncbi:MAG: peptidoglycan DD-metalloendopeptidase family protein [Cyanobacteria bacterium]|nr:peptidoglycan DD-metalloendopeptidase family protein [Cyanobacteriota bacterium]
MRVNSSRKQNLLKSYIVAGLIAISSGVSVEARVRTIITSSGKVVTTEVKPLSEAAYHRQRKIDANPDGRLKEISKRRDELRKKIYEMRKKEKLAYSKLNFLNDKLFREKKELDQKQTKLKSTEFTVKETHKSLVDSTTRHRTTVQDASSRLKEIYEGRQLSLVETLFRADSIQEALDLSYYQERIVTQDTFMIGKLRAKTAALAARKASLENEMNLLSNIAHAFMKSVTSIIQEKSKQEQIAEELREKREYYEQAERELAHESKRLESQIPQLIRESERSNKNMLKGTGTMISPCRFKRLSSQYGSRFHPILRSRRMHTGVDLSAPHGTPVVAADSGNVIRTGVLSGYGNLVIINHGSSVSTLYGHLSSINVATGQNVKRGEVIGRVGATGRATGPHLHFEVRIDGKHTNPLSYVHL